MSDADIGGELKDQSAKDIENLRRMIEKTSAIVVRCEENINRHSEGVNASFVTICVVMLGFGSVSIVSLIGADINLSVAKIVLYIGWIMLLVSIIFGVVDKLANQQFWSTHARSWQVIHRLYRKGFEGEISSKIAEEIAMDIAGGKDLHTSIIWPRYVQAMTCILGLVLSFIAYGILIFQPVPDIDEIELTDMVRI